MTRLVALSLLLFLIACDKEETPSTSAEAAPTKPVPVKEPEPAEPVEVDPALPQADVKALVDAWLQAQNDGDFEAYQGAYATKVEGIKRVGPRMYRYDRAGWLDDRKRMFKKKMQVQLDDLQIQPNATTAIVTFQQTWASGNYKDVGPKQLVVVQEPDGLRITREEMLRSNVAGSSEAPSYDPEVFAMVIDSGVVLDLAPKRAWESGAPQLVSRGTEALKDLDHDKSGFGSWMGRDLELFGPDGEPCPAQVAELELRARVIPHFSTVQAWNGVFAEEGVPRASDEKVAAEIWRMAAESHSGEGIQLVAQVRGDCHDAVWARPKGGTTKALPAHRLDALGGRPLSGPTAQNVLDAFTDLQGYHDVQADFAASGGRGAWHQHEGASANITKFGSWVAVSARSGDGCGDFEGGFWGLWTTAAQGSLVLQTNDEDPGLWHFAPTAAAQVGDVVYFTDGERVVSRVDDSWDLLWHVLPLNFDCGC